MSVDDFAVLDNLEMIVVVDNETDTLSSIDPGVDQVPELPRSCIGCHQLATTMDTPE